MSPSFPRSVPDNEPVHPLLPPGLVWVYLLAPIGLALVIANGGASLSTSALLRRIVAQYIPFAAYAIAFRLAYAYVMPSLLLRATGLRREVALHLLVVIAVPPPIALLIHPVLEATEGLSVPLGRFILVSIGISAACILPAVRVQRLRVRALTAERQAAKERQAALQAQLEALQARTNPHFLFNSLNTVASLIPEEPELAERAVEQLGALLRYGLSVSAAHSVRLSEEVAMVSDYLALQSARYGERLRTRIQMDETLANEQVPPLLLQPLVENAVCHGTSGRGGCEVTVEATRTEETIRIEISDDGPGPGASSHAGTKSAVSGICERLRLRYGDRGKLELRKRAAGGCVAHLEIPLAETAGA